LNTAFKLIFSTIIFSSSVAYASSNDPLKVGKQLIEDRNFEAAFQFFIHIQDSAREANDSILYIRALNGAGVAMNEAGLPKKATHYFSKAQEIAFKKGNIKLLSFSLNNLGNSFFKSGEFDSALISYRNACKHSLHFSDSFGLSLATRNISAVYYELDSIEKAIVFGNQALDYFKRKKELKETCRLMVPDYSKEFYVATDASAVGIGAVLMQKEKGTLGH